MLIPEIRVARNMYGREDAIRELRCVSTAADGCGRQITELEITSWDKLTVKEYRQSGWCWECQNKIFKDPEEDECICDWVDVGLSVMMPMPQNDMCPTHGDEDLYYGPPHEYDLDLREDEPPSDMHEVQWAGEYT